MKFFLRDYRPGDLKSLWAIDQECFEPGISYSLEEMRTYLAQPGALAVIAETDGKEIAGFIIGITLSGPKVAKPFGYVITIDVRAAARKSGLGSQLIATAEKRMQRSGCGTVILEVAVDNHAAISFYKRHGYTKVATYPGYYSNGTDADEMVKAL